MSKLINRLAKIAHDFVMRGDLKNGIECEIVTHAEYGPAYLCLDKDAFYFYVKITVPLKGLDE